MPHIKKRLNEFMCQQQERKLWQKVVTVMAAIVVFVTIYALILPAITLEKSEAENTVQRIYQYEDDSLIVKVTLPYESIVPEDAILNVVPIRDSDEQYADLAEKAENVVDGQAEEIVLYDISFYTADNEYIPVSEEAMVSFDFKEGVLTNDTEEVLILHYEEEEPVQVENVMVEMDENHNMTSVTFQTEGFSVFAMIKVYSGRIVPAQNIDVTALNGKSFVIASHTGRWALSEAEHNSNAARRQHIALDSTKELSEYTVWTFVSADKGYKIRSTNNKYLVLSGYDLTITANSAQATVFTVENVDTNNIYIYTSAKPTEYYINIHGGEGNAGGFCGWNTTDNGSKLLLYGAMEELEDVQLSTDLAGKSFAIVHYSGGTAGRAVLSQMGDNNTKLLSKAVTVLDENTVIGNDISVWNFEASANGAENVYYVSTMVGEEKMYLAISGSYVKVQKEPRDVWVTPNGEGKVFLGNEQYINYYSYMQMFGNYGYADFNSQMLLCEHIQDTDNLFYDLNLSYLNEMHSASLNDGSWEGGSVPYLSESKQRVETDKTNLYTVSGYRNTNGYFVHVDNMASDAAVTTTDDIANINKFLKEQNEAYGKEFLFLGWEATVDGTTYLFPENAQAFLTESGIQIVDVNGNTVTIPEETILKGKWKEISDSVFFYVNYSGTILDTEDNVTGRNHREFTKCVGIGRVYYGTTTVGDDHYFASQTNIEINNMFCNEFNPDDPNTQIVMKYVAFSDGSIVRYENGKPVRHYQFDEKAAGINENELATDVLEYIKNRQEVIKISSAELNSDGSRNNPTIDPNNADNEHYKVRWYVLKEQVDAWHIDGVLVAETSEIKVTKNFSGLRAEQVEDVMGSLNINTFLGPNKESFVTIKELTTDEEQKSYNGQYEYLGKDASINSYSWTFHTIIGEKYVMEEQDYGYSGYDCSTIVVVRTKDGNYHEVYGTASTEEISDYLIGGDAESVTFNNFYTPEGTGILNLIKQDGSVPENDPSGKLQGAEFTLKDINGNIVQTAVSNRNGSVYFSGLEVGTYILEETKAPEGYVAEKNTWTVIVSANRDNQISVVVYEQDENGKTTETECFSDGRITHVYRVKNTPNEGTVVLTKQFTNLTETAMNDIRNDTENPYRITMTDQTDTANTYTLLLAGADTISQDARTYTWRLTGVPVGTYTIKEENFRHISSKDTVVGTDRSTVTVDYAAQCAVFDADVILGESSVIQIVNNYTDEFILRLIKTANSGTEKLSGAVFDVYCAYAEAADTSKNIKYLDPDTGKESQAYYKGTITVGEDGTGIIKGIQLSAGNEVYTYVLKEVIAPTGYSLLKEPIVLKNVGPGTIATVAGGNASGNYNNGYFDLSVENLKKEESKVVVRAVKNWPDSTGTKIDLQLYRSTDEVLFERVGDRISLDGIETTPWQYEWNDLPAYDDEGNEYKYYVQEVPEPGYTVTYSGNEIIFEDEGNTIYAGKTVWKLSSQKYEVQITNTIAYELPESGGIGQEWYPLCGMGLMLTAILILGKTRKREGRT